MKRLAMFFLALAAFGASFNHLPPAARRPLIAAAARLRAELKPVFAGVEDKLKKPEADPASSQPSAATLSAPTGGPVRRRPAGAQAASGAEDLRAPIGGPVLLDEGQKDETRTLANKLMIIAGGLAAFFMLIAWFRGDPNAKTLT